MTTALNLTINDARSVRDARLQLFPGLTLLGGKNGAGKTTIALALRAALLTDPIAGFGTNRHACQLMRRSAAQCGSVDLERWDGAKLVSGVSIKWPTNNKPQIASYPDDGEPWPAPMPIAIGAERFGQLDRLNRVRRIVEAFAVITTQQHVIEALREANTAEQLVDKALPELAKELLKRAGDDGWEALQRDYERDASDARGAWKAITHETYGSIKGASWAPPGWAESDFDATLLSYYMAERDKAKTNRDVAAASQHMTPEQRAALAKQIKDGEAAKASLEQLTNEQSIEQDRRHHLLHKLQGQTSGADLDAIACPHCGGLCSYVAGRLVDAMGPGDKAAAENAYRDAKAALAKSEARLRELAMEIEAARQLAAITETDAKAKLASSDTGEPLDLAQAELRLARTQERVDTTQSFIAAQDAHLLIQRSVLLAGVCSGDGARKRAMDEALKRINAAMAAVFLKLGYPTAQLDAKLEPMLGDVPYAFCAEHEQWLLDATLQVIFARRTKAVATVIDGLELLAPVLRRRFADVALRGQTVPVLATCTMDGPDDPRFMPDYWLRDGTVMAMGQPAHERAPDPANEEKPGHAE